MQYHIELPLEEWEIAMKTARVNVHIETVDSCDSHIITGTSDILLLRPQNIKTSKLY